ncbi:MAG: GntR family transcriptional regulator [Proteobacteria bacterium]|nr:MAG: GntR family transcriptional regulator [Pseudomonadota bacterium]
MLEIGRINTLQVYKQVTFGLYLDGGEAGEVLLPKRYVPKGTEVQDWLDVFIYLDSEDRLIATTQTPKVMVDKCAYLKVVSVTPVGAFLDWGLPKDLLVPFNEQDRPMEVGKSYVVVVVLDDATNRIVGSSRLYDYLDETADDDIKVGDAVDLMIAGQTDLGYKAVINHDYLGLLFRNEVFRELHPGTELKGFVKHIREDGKIDLRLDKNKQAVVQTLEDKILQHLKDNDGVSKLTDKSPPEAIYRSYSVSKANYKRALSSLYKQRKILITHEQIRLSEAD